MNKNTMWILAGVAGVVGIVFLFFEVTIGIIALALAAVLVYLGFYYKKKAQTDGQKVETPATTTDDDSELPDEIGPFRLRYHYSGVAIACATMPEYALFAELLKEGDTVLLVQEPDNPHDPQAVAVMSDDECVGYLHKGRLQDMANDYLKKDRPVIGVIEDGPELTMTLGFYKED